MGDQHQVQDKIDQVIATFQSVQQFSKKIVQEKLVNMLNAIDIEFRSVAYESAFVSLVSSGFLNSNGSDSEKWESFFAAHKSAYETQLVIGFGWAIAVHQKKPEDFLNQFDPLVAMLMLDGYGYYHALFRSRTTIHNLQIPDLVNENLLFAFDQGVGRGLWYICKGDLEKLQLMLEKYSEARKPNLWRGIGTASAFVGGVEAQKYLDLKHLAAEYHTQFIVGILFAVRSRVRSCSITESIQIACQSLTTFKVDTAFKLIEDNKKKASDYKEWLTVMLNNLKES